jgi:uncharacterized phage-associated protein
MKLYKLVYYAHAWWLAQKGTPLFDEDISAWPWGPVVRELYSDFNSAGRNPITTQRAARLVKTGQGPASYRLALPEPPDAEVMDFLKQIWEVHKPYTGISLSNATHMPGEPWTTVKDLHFGDLSSKPIIPNEVIRDAFQAKIANVNPS